MSRCWYPNTFYLISRKGFPDEQLLMFPVGQWTCGVQQPITVHLRARASWKMKNW